VIRFLFGPSDEICRNRLAIQMDESPNSLCSASATIAMSDIRASLLGPEGSPIRRRSTS
jgi:hypothetical protein